MSVVATAWPTYPLSEVGLLHCGQSPSAKDVNPDGKGTRYITGPEQWDGHKIHESKWTTNPKRVVPDGCIFITVKGSGVGKIFAGISGAIGRDIYAFEPSDAHSAKYIEYALKFTVQDILRNAVGDIPGISKRHILDHEILVPPLAEQERIVAEIEKQFSRLDEAVANLKRVKANLKRYKAAVLKAAVEGKLTEEWRKAHPDVEPASKLLDRILSERRAKWEEAELAKMEAKGKAPENDKWKAKYKEPIAPDVSNLPTLPAGWVWTAIEQLSWLVTSGSRGWGNYYSDEGVLFIRAQDIKTDNLNLRGVARVVIPAGAEGVRSSVSSQDILITITGANVTKSALVPRLDEVAFVSQHVALLKLNLPETAPFIFDWIVSPANGRKTLESWAYGAGKPGLSLEQVRSLPVALPPLSEQRQIDTEVDRHLSLIRETETQVDANLQRAERLRQSILTQAFSGRLTEDRAEPVVPEEPWPMVAESAGGYAGALVEPRGG